MATTQPPTENPSEQLTTHEKEILNHLLRPDDSYNADGVYWADLPLVKRIKFVTSYDAQEWKKELSSIGQMFVKDPLSPISYYFRNMVIPGAGLGLEGYVLFSIGNIKPLFQAAFPQCWKTFKVCSKTWTQAVDYLEICGIIVGQILVGILGDWIGRRWGLIQDVVIMFIGLVMLTAAWGNSEYGWVICYAWSLFAYGVGVGGEYPMTATSGMENAVGSGKISTKEDRLHRGRKVTSAFLMQGWGQFLNQVILILSLLTFHSGRGTPPYSKVSAQWTYRVSFAIPAVATLWLVYYRAYKMKSASKQLVAAKRRSKVTGYDIKSLQLTFRHFFPRILATAGCWFMNDVFFYGNKIFQSEFLSILNPKSKSIIPNWNWNLVNVGVGLVGYYLASLLIDNKLYGRKWMQLVGFLLDFILFIVPAYNYKYYTEHEHIGSFQTMYFLSSFFNQFGPNCVTFLVAAEVYPTQIRATAHGFSAAVGKCGALLATIVYNYIGNQEKFHFVPWFGLAGFVLTVVFLPDTTGLDLKEQERRWAFIMAGREHEYHGVAIHPKHLSLWERMRGVGKNYSPDLDYKQRIEELRSEWEEKMRSKASETAGPLGDNEPMDDDLWSSDVSSYFERTSAIPKSLRSANDTDESDLGEKVEGEGESE